MSAEVPVIFYREGTCSLSPLIAAIWADRPFKACRLEEHQEQENENFLKLNALGEVPVMFLDGIVLTENFAILQHIGLRNLAAALTFSPNTPAFDQLNRAMSFLTSDFHKSFHSAFSPYDFHPDKDVQVTIKKLTIEKTIRAMYQHTNDHLLRTTFMFDHPMVPDAYLFAMARWGEKMFDIKKEFPNVFRFQEAMKENQGVQLALAIEEGKQIGPKSQFLGHEPFDRFVSLAALRKMEVDRIRHEGEFTPQEHPPRFSA